MSDPVDSNLPPMQSQQWLWRRMASAFLGLLVALVLVGSGLALLRITEHNRDFTVAICEAQNEENRRQLTLWEGLIAISADNPSQLTEEQQAEQLAKFRALLAQTFVIHDCTPDG